MTNILLTVSLVLTVIIAVLLIVLLRKLFQRDELQLTTRLEYFEKTMERTERSVRADIAQIREELGKAAREQRQESAGDAKQLREEVIATLTGIADTTTKTLREAALIQKAQIQEMTTELVRLSGAIENKLEAIRYTVEAKLSVIQSDNAKQLHLMRQTVDEKLQGTLEKRLGESFKQVSERLEQVHKGLGEMQALAAGVGDLKRVLTNVKTRGIWGEIQLGALLEQVLTPDQYAANVATKDSDDRVEYAIRLPGRTNDDGETVWLPIDAKFPMEDYERLLTAQEHADMKGVEDAAKAVETRIRQCANDICVKYLNPPKTTDFGILFLPTEGLFAEVVRRPGLMEFVQRDHRVVIAGPTTLWSILNSLQMGFRTLAIQKRSSEVWKLLSAVKTEWSNYGAILDKVQKKLSEAANTVEKAQVRTRAVGRRLKEVQQLPWSEAKAELMLEGKLEDSGEESSDDN